TGLSLLEMSRRPGVVALKEVAGVDQVSCGSVGFRLAPRLNAAGRLEDAALGVELLLGTEKDRCDAIADQLDSCNRERQQIEQETCDAAVKLVADLPDERRTLVLAQQGWHPGVIGIVASRMVERYARPAVLIALEGESGKGSARSVAGFHLYKALQSCSEYLDAFGGHAFAAGLSLATARLEDFVVAFEAKAAALDEEALTPLLQHDGEVRLDELDIALLNEIERLAPFGAGNAEPAFIATGLRAQQVRLIGSDQSHLACTLRQDGFSHAAIGFGMARRREEFEGEIDILFTPQRNDWKGRTTLQLRIRDIRPSQSLP
ncbi:MAG: single-stranded-DNA-specific exonuclease RecJ, partial [Desulfuromonas sp.]